MKTHQPDLEMRYLVLKLEDIDALSDAEKITFWHLFHHICVNAQERKDNEFVEKLIEVEKVKQ